MTAAVADASRRQRVVAVIQARMGSTRLPGKVARPLAGRPILGWVIRAAQASVEIDAVVVATSTDARDDVVEQLARSAGAEVVRGPEDDVVARFQLASEETAADAIVRLTADCPLLDPAIISQVVALWRADPLLHYVATTLERTLPRGLDVELVAADVLRDLDASAVGWDRIHVTSALYSPASVHARVGLITAPRGDHFRVTLDEVDDAEAIEAIVAELGDRPPSWRELIALLDGRPDIVALNSQVEQKAMEQG